MKFRVIALFVLLAFSFGLSACSLAEDITPPPGYQSPTFLPTVNQISPTPALALTNSSTATLISTTVASIPGLIPAGTESATSSTEISTTMAAPVITFSGKVTNASGAPLTGALTAHLYLYNTGSSTLDETLTTDVQSTGQYQFAKVPADEKTTYFVMVEFDGVTYISDPATYHGKVTTYDLPVTIYDTTNDLNALSFTQIHMQFDLSVEGKVQARMLYVVNNLGPKSVVVQSDGTSIPFIQIPASASNVQYELAQGGSPLSSAANGFALLPGADKQYGILATFTLPYTSSLKLVQPFSLPVASETIIVPVGVRVSSEQLDDAGIQTYQGTNYHLYQGSSLASGSTLTLTLTGKPGDTAGSTLNRQTGILIGVGVAGILFIGLGVFLFLRDRTRFNRQVGESGGEIGKDHSDDDRDTIIDTIIVLDEQYKAGGISKEVYIKRRDELKKRLKELI